MDKIKRIIVTYKITHQQYYFKKNLKKNGNAKLKKKLQFINFDPD